MRRSFALTALAAYTQAIRIESTNLPVDATSTSDDLGSDEFPVTAGKIIGQVSTTSEFDLSFDIKPTGKRTKASTILNFNVVSQFNADNHSRKRTSGMRQQVPVVYFLKDSTSIAVNQSGQQSWDYGGYNLGTIKEVLRGKSWVKEGEQKLPMDVWSHMEIKSWFSCYDKATKTWSMEHNDECTKATDQSMYTRKTMISLSVNGKIMQTTEAFRNPTIFPNEKVNVYASNPYPWYHLNGSTGTCYDTTTKGRNSIEPASAQLKNVKYNGQLLDSSFVPETQEPTTCAELKAYPAKLEAEAKAAAEKDAEEKAISDIVPTTVPVTGTTPATGITFEESLESKELHADFLVRQAPYKSENDLLAAERGVKTATYFADFEATKAADSAVEEAKAHEATTSEKAATDSTALEEAEKVSAAAGQAHKDATADLEAKEEAALNAENMMAASKAAALAAHHKYVANVTHGSTTGYIH